MVRINYEGHKFCISTEFATELAQDSNGDDLELVDLVSVRAFAALLLARIQWRRSREQKLSRERFPLEQFEGVVA